jgi:hypothetical protein
MGVTPAAGPLSQGGDGAGGSGEDAEMGLDERDLADSKKIMLKLLVQVGSDAKVDRNVVASQQLPALAGAIAGDVEDGLGDYISDTLLACVTGFAHKTDIYAALLGCVNEEDGEFAEDVVNKTIKALETAITSGATRDMKLLLRFVCLWPAVRLCPPSQLFGSGCLSAIVDACVGAGEGARGRADEVIGAVMFALIWCSKALSGVESGAACISAMASRIRGAYMSQRPAGTGKPVAETLVFPNALSLRDEDGLATLLECLNGVVAGAETGAGAGAAGDDSLPSILADRADSVCRLASQTLDEAEPLDLPALTLGTADTWAAAKKGHGRSCTRGVRLFGDGGCAKDATFSWGGSYREKTLSAISALDRLCMRDLVLDILATHAPRSDESVAALLRCSFPGAEHAVLESIFVAMLRPPYLPNSCPSWSFYGGIIVRICKASKEYPPTLAETFDVLFEGVAGFPSFKASARGGAAAASSGSPSPPATPRGQLAHPVCVRLCGWFSWHLSQLKWKWPWKRLTGCLESAGEASSAEAELHRAGVAPQRVFLSALFQHLCRLSYHDLVREVIPERLHTLMPHIKNAPTNNYRFPDTSSAEDSASYRKFFDKLRSVFNGPDQVSDGNLLEWLQSEESPLPPARGTLGDDVEEGSDAFKSAVVKDAKSVHIVTIAILQSGHKTLTHALARADRFGSLLHRMSRAYGSIENSGVAIVDACAVFFSDTPHYWFCVVDGLIQREYLSISAFANWILRKNLFEMSSGYHLWDYLQTSVLRAAAGYFTRSANSAAAIPKAAAEIEEDAGRDEEQKENIYDLFTAFRTALSEDGDASDGEAQKRRGIIRRHGDILVALVRDCCLPNASLDLTRISL